MTERPRTLATLRALTDAELIELHDRQMANLGESVSLYRDELNRRGQERSARQTRLLSRISVALAIASFGVASGSLVATALFQLSQPALAILAIVVGLGWALFWFSAALVVFLERGGG
jgi:hypothetical protein